MEAEHLSNFYSNDLEFYFRQIKCALTLFNELVQRLQWISKKIDYSSSMFVMYT